MIILIYTNGDKSFRIEETILPRVFQVRTGYGGVIILRNIQTGNIIVLDTIDNIKVDGISVSVSTLEQIVYNYSCSCDIPEGNPNFKIFDYTFDTTFE